MGDLGNSMPVDPRGAVIGRVRGPAVAIAILAGLAVLGCVVNILWNVIFGASLLGMNGAGGDERRVAAVLSGGLGIAIAGMGLIVYAVALFGALRMYQGRSYILSWVATVLIALPCSLCCCFGLPIAIWSAMGLMDEQVRAGFQG